MAFLPTDTIRQLGIQGKPRPADDWHAQWGGGGGFAPPSPYFDPGSPLYGQTPPPLGGTPEASGPGGGDVPFQAGAQPPPMPDWSQYRGQPPVGGPPGVDWNRGPIVRNPEQGMPGPRGGYDDRGQWTPNPGASGGLPFSYPKDAWQPKTDLSGNPLTAPPAGGFTPLSQLGRGGAAPSTATTLAHQALAGGGGPGVPSGPGGMVLLRAPNGQTKPVPADQVAHYLARGATRG